jgi:hypothetical protein
MLNFIQKNINILLFTLILLAFQFGHQAHAESYSEFRSLLQGIKEAVSKENMVLALDLLSKASKMLNELEKRPVIDEEALRWDMAQINLDRSESMQNPAQRAYFANESIIKWNEYIEWFGKLDDAQLKIIMDNLASFRIQRAVRQLGNAYMGRDNIGDYSIRDMFAVYSDLPPKYLSSKSMNLWRSWLFRCPSWKPAPNSSLRKLKDKFESDSEYCKEDWDDFYGFLEEWIDEQELTSSKKRKYQRWLNDLGYSLGYQE